MEIILIVAEHLHSVFPWQIIMFAKISLWQYYMSGDTSTVHITTYVYAKDWAYFKITC